MSIRIILVAVTLCFVSLVSGQNEVALAAGLARAEATEFKAASDIYDAAADACKKARDKEGRRHFNDLKNKCEALDKCREAIAWTERVLGEKDYNTAMEQVKRARRFAKASTKISVDGYDAIDGEYTETAEALVTEVNVSRVQFYKDRLVEADRLIEARQYAAASEQLGKARGAMTDIVEANLFKMGSRMSSARGYARMIEGEELRDKKQYAAALEKFAEALFQADGQPVEGLDKNVALTKTAICANLPMTVVETYDRYLVYSPGDALREEITLGGCEERYTAPADTIGRQTEQLQRGFALYGRNASRLAGLGEIYDAYWMAPNRDTYHKIAFTLGDDVAESIKKKQE